MKTAKQTSNASSEPLRSWFLLADRGLDEAQKLLELHFTVCHDTLQEVASCCQRAGDVRDVQGAIQWQTAAMAPFAEQFARYGARLLGLASGSGREFSRMLEHGWQQAISPLNGWMGRVAQGVDAEQNVDWTGLGNAMNAFDSIWASTRRSLEQSQQQAWQAFAEPRSSVKRPVAVKKAASGGG